MDRLKKCFGAACITALTAGVSASAIAAPAKDRCEIKDSGLSGLTASVYKDGGYVGGSEGLRSPGPLNFGNPKKAEAGQIAHFHLAAEGAFASTLVPDGLRLEQIEGKINCITRTQDGTEIKVPVVSGPGL